MENLVIAATILGSFAAALFIQKLALSGLLRAMNHTRRVRR